jgi:hypothetical protein
MCSELSDRAETCPSASATVNLLPGAGRGETCASNLLPSASSGKT